MTRSKAFLRAFARRRFFPKSRYVKPGPDLRRSRRLPPSRFARRVALATTIILAILITLLAVWYLIEVFLVAFGGLLLGILLRSLSQGLVSSIHLPENWAFSVVVIALTGLIIAIGWFIVPHVMQQGYLLIEQIPQSLQRIEDRVRDYPWGDKFVESLSARGNEWGKAMNLFRVSTSVFTRTAGVLTWVLVVVFVALYVGHDPQGHKASLLHLLPPSIRPPVAECLEAMVDVLKWWLVGKSLSMLLVGVLTWVGLWALGVPLAPTLALIACLLAFVPNFGPIISVVPAMLVASLESLSLAGYVVLLYIAVQTIESYLITPLIQERAVFLPPAMIILGQVIMGILAGALGVALATPLLASLNVCLHHLYGRGDNGPTPPSRVRK